MHMKNEELKSREVTVCVSVCVRAWVCCVATGHGMWLSHGEDFTKCKLLSGSEKPVTTTEGSR